jgi:hypothetical protein
MLDEVDAAPERSLVAVLMHHHLVALPVESWLEPDERAAALLERAAAERVLGLF